FTRPRTERDDRWIKDALKDETFAGALLMISAVIAIIVANSSQSSWYFDLLSTKFEIPFLALNLTIAHWVSDGLLAIFFFIAGLELKHELVHGSLSEKSRAIVPVVAALAGMAIPVLIFATLVRGDSQALQGWAIPMATDIAFALAILAIAGRKLPTEIRAFLLTVAVVDDLGAISIIAIFYSEKFNFTYLALTLIVLFFFWLLHRINKAHILIALPLALVAWWAMYKSGVHATVAGVALALLVPNKPRAGADISTAERCEAKVHPISVLLVIPLFAFVAAGVDVRGSGIIQGITSPIGSAIILALVIGKFLGIFGATYLFTRFTRASLNENLRWSDVSAIALLAGIGFTVSLLIVELSYEESQLLADAKVGVLAASVASSLLAVLLLRIQTRKTLT
ncbi:MAG: Na+/H+ antiporter NhaA, partial [Actinobacteria bacterium]|nr:Na+/H+ antiporter NhaA [Actinomycetota bacterium]